MASPSKIMYTEMKSVMYIQFAKLPTTINGLSFRNSKHHIAGSRMPSGGYHNKQSIDYD